MAHLDELGPDPIAEFLAWKAAVDDDAVCLATAGADGAPDARMVLLKGASDEGFVFFTNRGSAKGQQLEQNPRAALVFWWPPVRQVRVRGAVEVVDDGASDAYWSTRPRASRLGAWASPQSAAIDARAMLESRLAAAAARFEGVDVPRPPWWGGYRLVPREIEFWLHQDDRLHDRIRYVREHRAWRRERLSP